MRKSTQARGAQTSKTTTQARAGMTDLQGVNAHARTHRCPRRRKSTQRRFWPTKPHSVSASPSKRKGFFPAVGGRWAGAQRWEGREAPGGVMQDPS